MPAAWRRGLAIAIAAGAAVTALGLVVAPERAWANVLVAGFLVLGVGLGGLLFLAFGHVTRAGWLAAFKRVPEAMAASLPLGAGLVALALAGLPWLYEWSHAEHAKGGWLTPGFFLLRGVAYLAAWLACGAWLLRLSRRQDATRSPDETRRGVAVSALFLALFAVTFSLASFDWLMSREPHWYSTVFAAYHFAGVFLEGLAVLTILLVALRRAGPLRGVVTDDHLHDVGKLTLAFATFWAYLWYCQHMLIWYGNLPEETAYYVARSRGAWEPLLVLGPLVNWLIPFLALLPRPAKRSEGVMLNVALLLLAGRWLDLYLQVLPPTLPDGPAFGPWEAAPVVAAAAAAILVIFRALRRAPLLPAGDPYLVESLHHRA